MSEPNYVDFKPRWMREREADDRILDDSPPTGSLAEVSPRVDARLLPLGGSNRLSAKTLSETIHLTQSIMIYAGHDVYVGPNPDFADLRSVSPEVITLAKLTIEPFGEGSFIIPARLEAAPLAIENAEQPRQVTSEDVVRRFDEILASLRQPASATQVSIGAIQTVEALGRVIRREAEAIEFSSFDALGQPSQSQKVDEEYISRVSRVRASRQPTREEVESLEGQVTALDIREGKLQLSMEGRRQRVIGHFTMLFLPTLIESLGRRVRLQGLVTWRRSAPVSIQVTSADVLSDDE